MRAVILIPWRPDYGPRTRNWQLVYRRWVKLRWPIYLGDSEPFDRTRARNDAAARAGDWEVALFADADIVLDSLSQAYKAVLAAYDHGWYTVAYSELYYLTAEGTEKACLEKPLFLCEQEGHVTNTWECCFAVRRDFFDKVGGFDERFQGYGGQVAAFFYAYSTFAGRERIPGDAYHLDHPLVDRNADPHFDANLRLAERYKGAVDNEDAMLSILEERT